MSEGLALVLATGFGALLGFVGSWGVSGLERRADRRARKKKLATALQAEAGAVRNSIHSELERVWQDIKDGRLEPVWGGIWTIPRWVFRGAAHKLGDLNDTTLIRSVVGFYDGLDTLTDKVAHIKEVGHDTNALHYYMRALVDGWRQARNLEAALADHTGTKGPSEQVDSQGFLILEVNKLVED